MKKMTKAALVLTVLGSGAVSAWAGGLATGPIGRMSGELVIVGDDGVRVAAVTAATSYLADTREGLVSFTIRQGGARLAHATAGFTAETDAEALGAVTALALAVTGQNPSGRSVLRLTDVRFDGDARAFAAYAGRLMDWWDAKARLAVDTYQSPRPDLASLGKLQLNIWGTTGGGNRFSSLMILFFDPADPTKVAGGTYRRMSASFDVVGGSLQADTSTPAPGDYVLEVTVDTGLDALGVFEVAIDALADGTFDVRGFATLLPAGLFGPFTVEGVGNAKFVAPGQ
jgi:hypothetical protein